NPYGQHRNKRHDDKLRDNTNKNGQRPLSDEPKVHRPQRQSHAEHDDAQQRSYLRRETSRGIWEEESQQPANNNEDRESQRRDKRRAVRPRRRRFISVRLSV